MTSWHFKFQMEWGSNSNQPGYVRVMAHPDCCQGTDERAMNQVLQEDTGQTSHVAFTILPTDHQFMFFFLKQPFYGDMMGISLATSANFAVLDFQTNSYHSHGKYMAGLTLSLSLSLAIEGDRCYLDRWVHISFYRFMYVDIHTQTDIHMGVYQTPNTVCRRRFNMSSIWFIYGIFICANTYTCMHTRKEWRF